MFKFLRKYNKYILAVGGTLLLITFLIPFAFTNLLQGVGRGGATWATVNDDRPQKVTVSDLNRTQRELQLLQYTTPQLGLNGIDRAEYWYLLQREAQQGGFVAAASTALRGQPDLQSLGLLSSASGENTQFVAQTMAKVQGVSRMIEAYLGSDRYSDRRLKHRARRMLHRATVQPVVLEASAPRTPATYTDEQLLEQMNAYAEVAPGEGDMGFGYRLPDRVKLEWLAVPADSVRAMIEASGRLNAVALRKHWRREHERDVGLGRASRFGPPESDAPVPDAVRSDLLNVHTAGSLDDIARHANDQLRIARRGLAHRGGYLELPDGWTAQPFADLALDIQSTFGVALPEYHAIGDRWLTAGDLVEIDRIGAASTDKFGQTPVGLSQLVLAAQAFGGSPTIPIQEGVAGPPLRGADGSVYLFRIIATDPSRPPASIDEVRAAVVADLDKLAHYRQLAETSDGIRQVATEEGLVALAMLHDTTVRPAAAVSLTDVSTLFSAGGPQPAFLPVIGRHEPTAAAIIDRGMALPPDVPLQDVPVEERLLVIPVEDRLSVLVALINEVSPLTEEQYRLYAQNGIIQLALIAEDLADVSPLDDAFSYDELARRHNFEIAGSDAPVTEPDAADDASQADAAPAPADPETG
ncbi:MAG: SurA N-terminal domain-containing protein [Planctomycetota bacterium]|jgi:hypothetical protein